ncbi:MAG: hypothetical protein IH598_04685 [Bacteroidales bacterium]|nr:hypothetical protein [Bacteroidales bacterium]
MLQLSKLTKIFIITLLLSPVMYYLFFLWTGLTFSVVLRILVIFLGILYLFKFESRIKVPGYAVFLLFFVLYGLIHPMITGLDREGSIIRFFYGNNHLAMFFMLIIINNTNFSAKFIRNAGMFLTVTVIVASIVSILQVFDHGILNPNQFTVLQQDGGGIFELYKIRRVSIFGFVGSNALGLSFIPLLSVLVGIVLFQRKKTIWPIVILGGIVAFLTNTRYVMVGYLIVLFQTLFYSQVRVLGVVKYVVITLFSVLVIYFAVLNFGYNINEWIDNRLFPEGSLTETTRYKAIGTFHSFFPEAPYFGTGEMTTSILIESRSAGSSHIHVGYLSHLVIYGIVGCFFLFGAWLLMARQLFKNARITGYWGSFFAMLTFLWSFLTMSESSLFFAGIVIAFVYDKFFMDAINKQQIAQL